MLGTRGYKYKNDLKQSIGKSLNYVETSMFGLDGLEFKPNGDNTVVGPDAYKTRNWYAVVTCKDGKIVKVK